VHIDDTPVGLLKLQPSAVSTCEGNVIRTYTVTEYGDTNKIRARMQGKIQFKNTRLYAKPTQSSD
jgi:hypothetical protein